ncbi:FAD/NAD-P-binding domain-containing protein [Lentinus tigrinus ALCF2SS1-7]|uniref:NADPH:adrenodoxin oxidoreductase, mitochondrial n=1 Tax=Lentinus tigrinus ALCF2SS1-6 TaxID=1328759 RepID=A0A5C2S0P5_9APHY|nr:FAD/NAD-P-binding domain-containing protein [Lentinus tigrinus ALCF2SS1-6]RPD71222.1 FAD/NAD-P-binding domain-containing protein [Lentinus tigrinus ALCF2SS1-7]
MAPIKLAIVGAGPSSFYVASRLLSLLPRSGPHASTLKIHLYDRLWAPYGLVRYGVAPDHPEVKNCTHKFDEAAADTRLRFFGNVNVGPTSPFSHTLPLSLEALRPYYTHVLYSTGCTVPILHPALPPSQYCIPALSMVHWYTQHPSKPSPPPLERTSHVTLIGQGNVSLDVARMLLTPPDHLAKYDVPTPVLDVLRRSAVQHVSIVGRRGSLQAAFTTKELREMMNLPDSSMVPLDPALLADVEGTTMLTRQQSRTLQLLQKGSKNKPGTTKKTWSLDFFRSPTGLTTPTSSSEKARLTLAHTMLDPSSRAVPTGESSTLETDLVITSLGHRSEPSAPWYEPGLGHLRAMSGRVVNADGRIVRNVYASGWAAMGARGVLASTMMDAYAVADTILRDHFPGEAVQTMAAGAPESAADKAAAEHAIEILPKEVDLEAIPPDVEAGLEEGRVTDFEDWKKVNAEEIRRGQELGKERERMEWEEARDFLAKVRTQVS